MSEVPLYLCVTLLFLYFRATCNPLGQSRMLQACDLGSLHLLLRVAEGFGVECLWSMVSGSWCMEYVLWIMVHGLCCVVYGSWCMVYGLWCMVYGVWCMVYGVWFMVYGIWCMVYD